LPLVVGLPVVRVVVDAAGLPLVAGLPDVVGLPDALPCPWANAGESVKDIAATKLRIVGETRIRVPPRRRVASRMPRSTVSNLAEIQILERAGRTILCRSYTLVW
jgi:hypothetical protein